LAAPPLRAACNAAAAAAAAPYGDGVARRAGKTTQQGKRAKH